MWYYYDERMKNMEKILFDEFTRGYVECALWTTDPHPGQGEWSPHDDMVPENMDAGLLSRMMSDCADFQESESAHGYNTIGEDLYRAGMDFWLTRNGHGSGFWDGRWEEKEGKRLSDVAKAYGGFDIYIGDDGRIYG